MPPVRCADPALKRKKDAMGIYPVASLLHVTYLTTTDFICQTFFNIFLSGFLRTKHILRILPPRYHSVRIYRIAFHDTFLCKSKPPAQTD